MHGPHTLEFRALVEDPKFQPLGECDLDAPLNEEIAQFINRFVTPRVPGDPIRILDFGCGRGQLIGQLRKRGFEAYGVDVDARFIESGRIVRKRWPSDRAVLSLLDVRGQTIFPEGFFDAVISDQVLEHVSDLNRLAAEMSRVLRPGGAVFHRFPGRRILTEPHYYLPVVHWLPRGSKARFHCVHAMVKLGMGVKMRIDLPARLKARIICEYANTHTFYRSPRAIADTFAQHDIALAFGPIFRWWLIGKLDTRLKIRGRALRMAEWMLRSDRLTRFLGDIYHWRVSGVKQFRANKIVTLKPRS